MLGMAVQKQNGLSQLRVCPVLFVFLSVELPCLGICSIVHADVFCCLSRAETRKFRTAS